MVSTRWVEDKIVAEYHQDFLFLGRSCQIKTALLIKLFKHAVSHQSGINCLKIYFFAYVAGIMQPYLTCYQGDGPLVPFMIEGIQNLFKSFLQVVLEPKHLPDCTGSLDLLEMQLQDVFPLKRYI